jgi:hypothetical protein
MLNSTILVKVKERLNKLSSDDYDNLQCWQIIEAFNKAQVEWCRRQLHGNNLYQEGDEYSKRRVDDLQILLTEVLLTGTSNDDYFESNNFPTNNYLEFKRVTAKATNECCTDPRTMTVYLVEEANIDLYLRDPLKKPDFEWSETLCTLIGNNIRVYKDDSFNIVSPVLTYYRRPAYIQIIDCVNPYTGQTSIVEIECEFKDDIVEVIIDEAAAILAGDMENFNQYTREQQAAERNN